MQHVMWIALPAAVVAVTLGQSFGHRAQQQAAAPAPPAQVAPAGLTPLGPGRVELFSDRMGHFSANVEIAGQRFPMLVDTGATSIALTAQDAAAAKIQPGNGSAVMVSTANGVTVAHRVSLASVRIGSIVVFDVEATVMPRGALSTSLLGMSFLKRLDGFDMSSTRLVLRK